MNKLLVLKRDPGNTVYDLYNIAKVGKIIDYSLESILELLEENEIYVILELIEVSSEVKVPVLASIEDTLQYSDLINFLSRSNFSFPTRNINIRDKLLLSSKLADIRFRPNYNFSYYMDNRTKDLINKKYRKTSSLAYNFFCSILNMYKTVLIDPLDYAKVLGIFEELNLITREEAEICTLLVKIEGINKEWLK